MAHVPRWRPVHAMRRRSKIQRPFKGGRCRGIGWIYLRATWQCLVLLAYYDPKDYQKIMVFSRDRGNIVSGFGLRLSKNQGSIVRGSS